MRGFYRSDVRNPAWSKRRPYGSVEHLDADDRFWRKADLTRGAALLTLRQLRDTARANVEQAERPPGR